MTTLGHFLLKNGIKKKLYLGCTRLATHQRWNSSQVRQTDGTLIVKHDPTPSAPRLAPTPLVFVGSSDLEDDGGAFLSLGRKLASEAASRGFSSFQFDLPFRRQANETAEMVLDRLALHLRSLISTTDTPFPPILYAEQLSCLIAQTYVSSYPVSALILDSPPLSNASLPDWPGLAQRFPMPLPEFTFEPRFPVLVLERQSAGGLLKNGSRLVQEGADYAEVCENAVEKGRSHLVEQWIDELGL